MVVQHNLTAINSKYIHSNLAVYSLQAYAREHGQEVELAEYTINQQLDDILENIYRQAPDLVAFSCYIWNITYVKELVVELKKILPQVQVWAGGPEVSFDTVEFLTENKAFDGLMMGEGEKTFLKLCHCIREKEGGLTLSSLDDISGISYRMSDDSIRVNPLRELMDMDDLPFCYKNIDDFKRTLDVNLIG